MVKSMNLDNAKKFVKMVTGGGGGGGDRGGS